MTALSVIAGLDPAIPNVGVLKIELRGPSPRMTSR